MYFVWLNSSLVRAYAKVDLMHELGRNSKYWTKIGNYAKWSKVRKMIQT